MKALHSPLKTNVQCPRFEKKILLTDFNDYKVFKLIKIQTAVNVGRHYPHNGRSLDTITHLK